MAQRARYGTQLTLACLWLLSLSARAQDNYQPRWVTFRITDAYLAFDSEFEQQTVSTANTAGATTLQRIYLAPAIGVDAMGSIYHPNLFSYSLEAEPGYEYQKISYTGSGASGLTQNTVLQNYRGSGTLFQSMPFATTVSGSQDHQVTDYDLFNTVTVDSHGYGVSTGYKTGPVPVTLTYQDSYQDTTGIGEELIQDQQNLDLHARSDRGDRNFTDLTYHYGTLDQTVNTSGSSFVDNSTYQIANLIDSERWGEDDRYSLVDTLLYNQLDTEGLPSQTFTAQSDFGMDLTPRLRNTYDYNFIDYSDNMSDYEQNFGRAALRHQLYDSLTSSIDVHGGTYHSGSGDSTVDSTTVGVRGILDYRKNLGSWGHLSFGNSAQYDLINQTSTGGASLVPNEAHVISIVPTPLNQPQDLSIVSVTDSTGTKLLREGIDYSVDRNVNPWEIQLIPTSLSIKSGDIVLVTYTVQANPSGSYSTFEDQLEARLDLFNRLFSLYARLHVVQNFTNDPGFVLENLVETQAGAEFNWHGLHLGADYDKRNSSLYDYTTESLSEGYQVRALSDCTFSLDFHQRWTDYSSQDVRATYYDFIGRFQWQPTSHLTCSVEGGLEQQRGRGLDQDLAAARAHVDWSMGKLSVNLGYEYSDENYAGQLNQRHFLFLKAKRRF